MQFHHNLQYLSVRFGYYHKQPRTTDAELFSLLSQTIVVCIVELDINSSAYQSCMYKIQTEHSFDWFF